MVAILGKIASVEVSATKTSYQVYNLGWVGWLVGWLAGWLAGWVVGLVRIFFIRID